MRTKCPIAIGLREWPCHEFDADRDLADGPGWDCDRGEAQNGAQSPIVPRARCVRKNGSGHDMVGDDSEKVIERA